MDSRRDLSTKDNGMCPHGNLPSKCVQCQKETEAPDVKQEKKWGNLKKIYSDRTYDVLEKLKSFGALPKVRNDRISLPEGKDIHIALLRPDELMDYAEGVLADTVFWDSSPEQVSTIYPGFKLKKEALKTALLELVAASK